MKNKKIFATIFVIECLEQSLQKGGKARCTSEEKEKLLKLNKKLKKLLTYENTCDKIHIVELLKTQRFAEVSELADEQD